MDRAMNRTDNHFGTNELRDFAQVALHTMSRGRGVFMHTILCLVTLIALAGCASQSVLNSHLTNSDASTGGQARAVNASQSPDSDGRPVQGSQSNELHAQQADDQASPEADRDRPHLPRVDPGARVLVDRMLQTDTDRPRGPDGWTWISLESLRNLSHAGSDEFAHFKSRLAKLLSRAGRDDRLRFVAVRDDQHPLHRHLGGTAYVVTAAGFDQWELYLTLMPADESWTLWRSDGPVRVLRSKPQSGQQVFIRRAAPEQVGGRDP